MTWVAAELQRPLEQFLFPQLSKKIVEIERRPRLGGVPRLRGPRRRAPLQPSVRHGRPRVRTRAPPPACRCGQSVLTPRAARFCAQAHALSAPPPAASLDGAHDASVSTARNGCCSHPWPCELRRTHAACRRCLPKKAGKDRIIGWHRSKSETQVELECEEQACKRLRESECKEHVARTRPSSSTSAAGRSLCARMTLDSATQPTSSGSPSFLNNRAKDRELVLLIKNNFITSKAKLNETNFQLSNF